VAALLATITQQAESSPLANFNIQIYDTRIKKWISMHDAHLAMGTVNMVFVGEIHNHAVGHMIEYQLLSNYYYNTTESGIKHFALSLEMFERDVQPIVSGYLSDQMTRGFFLDNSRPWPNYETDYQPMVEFIHKSKNNSTVLAANVPRRYAALVAAGNESVIWEMPSVERSWVAPAIDAPHDEYYKIFYEMFKKGMLCLTISFNFFQFFLTLFVEQQKQRFTFSSKFNNN